MIVHPPEQYYATSDTALAAFLITQSLGIPDITFINGGKAVYHFSKTPKLLQSVLEYNAAQATTNVKLFFEAYQSLLSRIRERDNG